MAAEVGQEGRKEGRRGLGNIVLAAAAAAAAAASGRPRAEPSRAELGRAGLGTSIKDEVEEREELGEEM